MSYINPWGDFEAAEDSRLVAICEDENFMEADEPIVKSICSQFHDKQWISPKQRKVLIDKIGLDLYARNTPGDFEYK